MNNNTSHPFGPQPSQSNAAHSPFGAGDGRKENPFGAANGPGSSPFGPTPSLSNAPFGSNFSPQQSPFGEQQPPTVFADAPVPTPSTTNYSLGVVDNAEDKRNPSIKGTSIFDAPNTLWIATLFYGLGAMHVIWLMVQEVLRANPHDLIVLILVMCLATLSAGIFGILKAQSWGRWVLSAMTVLSILVVVVPDQFHLAPLGIIGVILVWLPSNRPWFGYLSKN